MKKFDIKSAFLGFIIGTIGMTTALAANGIKSANLSSAKIMLDGASVPLNNSLVEIEKDGEKDARLYIPVREIFEHLGYNVEFDSKANTVKLNSPKHNIDLPESLSMPRNRSIPMDNKIPEYFTSGGIAKTTQSSNTYTYEGVIGADKYQFGNPFPANKGKRLTFKLNSLEYISGEVMEEDEAILRVIFGVDDNKNNQTGFNFMLKDLDEIALSMPTLETANYNISIYNYSGKEVKYSFTLTIK